MKKKILILIPALVLGLTGCGGNPSTSGTTQPTVDPTTSTVEPTTATTTSQDITTQEVVVTSVAITNKEALQETWQAGGEDRKVVYSIALGDGTTLAKGATVTSSNPEVVSVMGAMLSALQPGSATITVTYGDKSDSVDVTVADKWKATDVDGVKHTGTLADPVDVDDAIILAKFFGKDGASPEVYIRAVLTNISIDVSYGNATGKAKSSTGEVFTFYRFMDVDGAKFTDANKLAVNDTVVVLGSIYNYNDNTPETNQGGQLVSFEKGQEVHDDFSKLDLKHAGTEADPFSMADAVTIAKSLDANATTIDAHVMKGVITSVAQAYSTDNKKISLWMGDTSADGKMFEIYGMVVEADVAEKLVIGAEFAFQAKIKYYVSSTSDTKTCETDGEVKVIGNIKAPEIEAKDDFSKLGLAHAGTEADPFSIADAVKIANTGNTTIDEYYIKGIVTEVAYKWANGTMSTWMGDAVTDGQMFEFYKLACSEDQSKDVVVGSTVVAKSHIQLYNGKVAETSGTCTLISVVKGQVEQKDDFSALNLEHQGIEADPFNVADAVKIAASGVTTVGEYFIKGIIVKMGEAYNADFGNISVWVDDTFSGEQVFEVYRLKVTAEQAAQMVVGATVVVKAAITHYNSTLETAAGGAFVSVTAGDDFSALTLTHVGTARDPFNVADAATIAATGNKTKLSYYVQGIMTGVASAYSEQFGNISIWVADTADGGNVFQFYRVTVTAEQAATLVNGALVTVCGQITSYTKDGVTTLETAQPTTLVKVETVNPDALKETVAYPGGTTTNMDGSNQAELLGVKDSHISVVGSKENGGSNNVGLNKDGTMRLYKGGTSSITISITGGTILSIDVEFGGTFGALEVNGVDVGGAAKTTINVPVNGTSAKLLNTNSGSQTHIVSIVINYTLA